MKHGGRIVGKHEPSLALEEGYERSRISSRSTLCLTIIDLVPIRGKQ